MTAYLSTKLEGGGNVETSIWNRKVFKPVWLDLAGPNTGATKAKLQEEYGTRAKGVEKLRINLSTAYGLVLRKCKDYLQSRIKGQDKWETMPNERDLLRLLKSVKSLSHKYNKDTEYHHVVYHTLLSRLLIFRQWDYSNSDYKRRFKEQIKVYNGGFLFGNVPGDTAQEITMSGLNSENEGDVEKAQISARGK